MTANPLFIGEQSYTAIGYWSPYSVRSQLLFVPYNIVILN